MRLFFFSAIVALAPLCDGQIIRIPGPGGKAPAGSVATTNHSRTFNGTSDYLQSSASLSSLSGLTTVSFSFWLYWDSFANDDQRAFETSPDLGSNPGSLLVDPNGTFGTFDYAVSGSFGGEALCTITRPSAAAWHHYVLGWNLTGGTLTCTAYVDGVSTTPTTYTLSTTFSSQVLYVMSHGGSTMFGSGRVSEPALYNGIVNQTDATALAGCGRPTSVTSATLLYYWPINQTSPETPTTGSGNLTVTGTSNSASSCSF